MVCAPHSEHTEKSFITKYQRQLANIQSVKQIQTDMGISGSTGCKKGIDNYLLGKKKRQKITLIATFDITYSSKF